MVYGVNLKLSGTHSQYQEHSSAGAAHKDTKYMGYHSRKFGEDCIFTAILQEF